ncbi:unnamed protein product [Caenorhabditis sp. 36 PRJEB53466]|nr:unnamed protein product [Caenorhabditis sp. 36 PRJEB53466]
MMRSVFIALCLVVSVSCWTNEQLLMAVETGCKAKNYMCPKEEYGIFEGSDWTWDKDAIVGSPLAEVFRKSRHLTAETAAAITEAYCCTEGSCLYRCGIYPKVEIDLIEAFPTNAHEIFKLDLPELEKYREFVLDWLRNEQRLIKGRIPAEIEEFFDALHTHQKKIREKLRAQQEARRND